MPKIVKIAGLSSHWGKRKLKRRKCFDPFGCTMLVEHCIYVRRACFYLQGFLCLCLCLRRTFKQCSLFLCLRRAVSTIKLCLYCTFICNHHLFYCKVKVLMNAFVFAASMLSVWSNTPCAYDCLRLVCFLCEARFSCDYDWLNVHELDHLQKAVIYPSDFKIKSSKGSICLRYSIVVFNLV
jgi:hypothetical protein